jgi:hypothetical protein
MPLINGQIVGGWAVVDVMVGVSDRRRSQLRKNQLPVPHPVHVRALIDTGSSISALAPRVFRELRIIPVTRSTVITPSTKHDAPHECNFYDVSLALVAGGSQHPFPESRVIEADCWHSDEGLDGLIGMDILCRCFLQFHGPERTFTLAF